jgi:hypothetical protein
MLKGTSSQSCSEIIAESTIPVGRPGALVSGVGRGFSQWPPGELHHAEVSAANLGPYCWFSGIGRMRPRRADDVTDQGVLVARPRHLPCTWLGLVAECCGVGGPLVDPIGCRDLAAVVL